MLQQFIEDYIHTLNLYEIKDYHVAHGEVTSDFSSWFIHGGIQFEWPLNLPYLFIIWLRGPKRELQNIEK